MDYIDQDQSNMYNKPDYNMEMEYEKNVEKDDTRQVIMNAFD